MIEWSELPGNQVEVLRKYPEHKRTLTSPVQFPRRKIAIRRRNRWSINAYRFLQVLKRDSAIRELATVRRKEWNSINVIPWNRQRHVRYSDPNNIFFEKSLDSTNFSNAAIRDSSLQISLRLSFFEHRYVSASLWYPSIIELSWNVIKNPRWRMDTYFRIVD